MRHLSIDIETKSSVDIGKAGLYRYAQSPDFEILLIAYKFDERPVKILDLTDEKLRGKQGALLNGRQKEFNGECAELCEALRSPRIIKHAYNAAFEWYCLNQAGFETPLEQWRCTMAHGAVLRVHRGTGRHGKGDRAPAGQAEADGGESADPVFLRALQAHQVQWEPDLEPPEARARKVVPVQGLLQAGRRDGKRDTEKA